MKNLRGWEAKRGARYRIVLSGGMGTRRVLETASRSTAMVHVASANSLVLIFHAVGLLLISLHLLQQMGGEAAGVDVASGQVARHGIGLCVRERPWPVHDNDTIDGR